MNVDVEMNKKKKKKKKSHFLQKRIKTAYGEKISSLSSSSSSLLIDSCPSFVCCYQREDLLRSKTGCDGLHKNCELWWCVEDGGVPGAAGGQEASGLRLSNL